MYDSSNSTNASINKGHQRGRLPVAEFYSGTGNATINLSTTPKIPHPMRDLVFMNDEDVTTTVVMTGESGDLTIVFKTIEIFDERVPEFYQVAVTSTGEWRFYVRSGRLE